MASNYIKEIADNIRQQPKCWEAVPEQNNMYCGLTNGAIRISQCGLSGRWALFSLATLHVNGKPYKLQGNDRSVLDRAVLWWYRTQPLNVVMSKEQGPTKQINTAGQQNFQ